MNVEVDFGILKTDMVLGLQKLGLILENKVSLNSNFMCFFLNTSCSPNLKMQVKLVSWRIFRDFKLLVAMSIHKKLKSVEYLF